MTETDPPPNCPLQTGLRPCMCEAMPRCPVCNYTEHDAAFESDHASCPGRIPDADDGPDGYGPDESDEEP